MKDYKKLQEKLVKLNSFVKEGITFDEDTHTYFYKGNILKSVTQLLSEKGISPSYDNVDKDLLAKASERGTQVHALIEKWIKTGIGEENPYLDNFIDYLEKNNLIVIGSEVIVSSDKLGGCIDLILFDFKHNAYIIADIKTTSVIHTYSVSWQLSLYNYLETTHTYSQALVLHFDKEGNLNAKEVEFQNEELVEQLATKETLPTIKLDENELTKVEQAITLIEMYKAKIKENEELVNKFNEDLINAMESNNVKSFENERLKITYVAPVKRETLDSKKLKVDLPDIAKKYTKESVTKASIRITLKGNSDEKE